ncbi:hypothetical protein JCM14469_12260 [Desulfatiferula olefinivorans]
MKNRFIISLTIVTACLLTSVFARAQDAPEHPGRLTGRVELGLVGIATTSRTSGVDPDSYFGLSERFSRIDTLDKNRSFEHFGSALFLFEIDYLLSDTVSIYLGTPFLDDDREGLTAGLQTVYDDGSLLDLSVFGGGGEAWKDPYLTGVDRETTDVDAAGVAVDYDGILGTGLHMRYAFRGDKVDDDVSGNADADLKRSGLTHTLKAGYTLFLNDRFDTLLSPSFYYTRHDAKGGAYAADGIGMELSYAMERGDNGFSLAGTVESTRYDKRHPLFGKTREETCYTLECFYTRKHLWNKNWYTRLGVGINRVDANIGFFDETSVLYGVSLGYAFE